ncbi:TNF receptor-associated factor 6-like [Dendronephthya gigantea]|uniref:TNF receptor-associated factor 6-like n=1 Tax=Dendronephthya gigantea TaxID=151771 RepID=UPI00106CD6CD|nr:TNF receptor-associated factor 6-like [Dendronephthya gigantea]
MPGMKITHEVRKNIDPKFICSSCKLLLIKPMQTTCGHLICSSCVDTLLECPNPVCPEDGTKLKMKELFLDRFTERELRGLVLRCPNEGCHWHGAYDQLLEHLPIFDQAQKACVHHQCGVSCGCRDVKSDIASPYSQVEY